MSEWKIVKFKNPSGSFIINHYHDFTWHIVWPHDSLSVKNVKKHHCMECNGKAPDYMINQWKLLNE